MVLSELVIALYNNLAYSLAVIILLSTLMHGSIRRYIVAFSLITIAGLSLTFAGLPNWIMPINTILLTLCFFKSSRRVNPKEQKEYSLRRYRQAIRRTFYYCLTISTLTWCAIATLSSLIMLISPSWLYSDSYNIFMGLAMLGGALIVKAGRNLMGWCRQLEHDGHAIALQLVVLIFFSFVLPMYYPAIYNENTRQWGIFVLSFMAVLVIVGLLINRIKDLEFQRRSLAWQMEQQKSYAGQIQSQFDRVVTLKHFYSHLYHSLLPFIRSGDIDGLRIYFEENITPIHQSQIDGVQISNIKNDLIRNLLDVTIGQAIAIGNITLDMDATGDIRLPDYMLMDIFEIMSNLLDNSLKELKFQLETQLGEKSPGLLRLWLHESDGQLSMQIANTIRDNVDIERMYDGGQKGGECGYGLRRIREIVYSHVNMEHLTYKSGKFAGKEILIQQIVVYEDD